MLPAREAPPFDYPAVRARIDGTDPVLADTLGVPLRQLRAWASGSEAVPARYARELAWWAGSADRERALEAHGLRPCPDLGPLERTMLDAIDVTTHELTAFDRALKAVEKHTLECPRCSARARFLKENFPELGPFPESGVVSSMWGPLSAPLERVLTWRRGLVGVPRAAATGALLGSLLPMAITVGALIRVVTFRPDAWSSLVESLILVPVFVSLGASWGAALHLFRRTLRRLGFFGRLLTGFASAQVLMLSLSAVSQIPRVGLFEEGPFSFEAAAWIGLPLGLVLAIGFSTKEARDWWEQGDAG
jgi:hypothetical protein